MAIFINTGEHPNVYKNNEPVIGKNQSYYRKDYFTELLKAQEQVNETLVESLTHLKKMHTQETDLHHAKYRELQSRLVKLSEQATERENFEGFVRDSVNIMSEKNNELQGAIEQESKFHHTMLDEMTDINQSNRQIMQRLDEHEALTEEIDRLINEITNFQKTVEQENADRNVQHDLVIDRLENQEALMEKTLRQMNNLRMALFERTNHLAEKIEESYSITATYVYNMLTASTPLVTLLAREEKKQKQSKK